MKLQDTVCYTAWAAGSTRSVDIRTAEGWHTAGKQLAVCHIHIARASDCLVSYDDPLVALYSAVHTLTRAVESIVWRR